MVNNLITNSIVNGAYFTSGSYNFEYNTIAYTGEEGVVFADADAEATSRIIANCIIYNWGETNTNAYAGN